MRVALVTPELRVSGGVASHVLMSASLLAADGHEVRVVSGDAGGREWLGFAVHELPGMPGAAQGPAVRQDILSAVSSSDVVHIHGVNDPHLVRSLACKTATVISEHNWSACPSGLRYFGRGAECFKPLGPGCISNMAFRNCNHRYKPRGLIGGYQKATMSISALRSGHVAIAHSTAVVRHLTQNRVLGARLVPLPVSSNPGLPAAHGERVFFAGRLVPAKGVAVLLQACRSFDAAVDICGDGHARPTLERQARRLGLDNRAAFHGWCSEERLAAIRQRAALAVVPSLWPEPFGLVGPEAMAAGLPVVASNSGGIPDWLNHGRNGLLVPPGQPRALGHAIAALLRDDAMRHTMGQAGLADVATRWSPAVHLDALLQAYEHARKLAAFSR